MQSAENTVSNPGLTKVSVQQVSSVTPEMSRIPLEEMAGVTNLELSNLGGESEKIEETGAEDNNKVYDRYGFEQKEEMDNDVNSSERVKMVKIEAKKLESWRKVLDRWQARVKANPGKVKLKIRDGIPDRLRGLVWSTLIGTRKLMDREEGVFQRYQHETAVPDEDVILRDLPRTFPGSEFFCERRGWGQKKLYNVLRAYALYNKKVGYCQGMGFIAGVLLMYMTEEEAFWSLVLVIGRHEMTEIFLPGLPALGLRFYQLERLMKKHVPKLSAHLTREGIMPSMFASQWFITVFSYNLPFESIVRIWDCFLSEGYKIVFRVAIALLKIAQPELLKMPFEQAIIFLQQLPPRLTSPDRLLQVSFKIHLSRRQLKKYRQEYETKGLAEPALSPFLRKKTPRPIVPPVIKLTPLAARSDKDSASGNPPVDPEALSSADVSGQASSSAPFEGTEMETSTTVQEDESSSLTASADQLAPLPSE